MDEWKTRIATQIQGDLKENPTGQALADLIQKEQRILAKEVRRLQDKAWKARKRASERREHRNKNQNLLLKRISLLEAAFRETAPLQPQDKIKRATRQAMQGLDSYTSNLSSRNWSDNTTDGKLSLEQR